MLFSNTLCAVNAKDLCSPFWVTAPPTLREEYIHVRFYALKHSLPEMCVPEKETFTTWWTEFLSRTWDKRHAKTMRVQNSFVNCVNQTETTHPVFTWRQGRSSFGGKDLNEIQATSSGDQNSVIFGWVPCLKSTMKWMKLVRRGRQPEFYMPRCEAGSTADSVRRTPKQICLAFTIQLMMN